MKQPYEGILIVSDLDGTFLGKDSRIVPENIEALQDFLEKGGHFTFATGRLHRAMPNLLPQLHRIVNAPMIACNGTILYDFQTESVLYERTMECSDAMLSLLQAELAAHPSLRFWVHAQEVSTPFSAQHPFDLPSKTVHKLVIFHEEAAEKRDPVIATVRQKLTELLGDTITICQSSAFFLELLPKGATKGGTLRLLRKHYEDLGTPMRVYAMGDYENDLTLLQAADVACCPENAIDTVKAVCTYHLCHHDKGATAHLISILKQSLCTNGSK